MANARNFNPDEATIFVEIGDFEIVEPVLREAREGGLRICHIGNRDADDRWHPENYCRIGLRLNSNARIAHVLLRPAVAKRLADMDGACDSKLLTAMSRVALEHLLQLLPEPSKEEPLTPEAVGN